MAKLALLGCKVEYVAGLVFGQCIMIPSLSASWLQRTRKTAVYCIVLHCIIFEAIP
jgi:hypothetical protein